MAFPHLLLVVRVVPVLFLSPQLTWQVLRLLVLLSLLTQMVPTLSMPLRTLWWLVLFHLSHPDHPALGWVVPAAAAAAVSSDASSVPRAASAALASPAPAAAAVPTAVASACAAAPPAAVGVPAESAAAPVAVAAASPAAPSAASAERAKLARLMRLAAGFGFEVEVLVGVEGESADALKLEFAAFQGECAGNACRAEFDVAAAWRVALAVVAQRDALLVVACLVEFEVVALVGEFVLAVAVVRWILTLVLVG